MRERSDSCGRDPSVPPAKVCVCVRERERDQRESPINYLPAKANGGGDKPGDRLCCVSFQSVVFQSVVSLSPLGSVRILLPMCSKPTAHRCNVSVQAKYLQRSSYRAGQLGWYHYLN